jgi:enamine deaminase RidA (YjgF/YER057c/UK114 family)
MIMSEVSIDKLAMIYSKIRTRRSEVAKEDARLKEQLELVAHKIHEICKAQGVSSLRTEHGLLTRVVKDRYWVNDWKPFEDYIKDRDALHLLQHRISDPAMREWIKDNPNDFPPALNCDREYELRFTKPRKEVE